MAKLLYQGHASLRITCADKRVIYIDPFAGTGYEPPADLILVTHRHGDHDRVELITQKEGCRLITQREALAGGRHNTLQVGDIRIEAVPASNRNHDPKSCVGYILTVDGVSIYVAGDTSRTEFMDSLAARSLDYALLPCDGVYNMDLEEASACAALIAAKHTIPIHMKPRALFDRDRAEAFRAPCRLILEPGQEIEL